MQFGQRQQNNFFLLPKFVKTPFLIVYLLTLISALATLVFYFRAQPQIPIFYSLPEPAQHLAAKEWLFLFPSLSLVSTLIHVAITKSITTTDKLLVMLFSWSTVVVQVVLVLALFRIIYIIS
jgi:hypothetical protein